MTIKRKLLSISGFESLIDVAILTSTVAICSSLLTQKLHFLFTVYGSKATIIELMIVCLTNSIVYIALCTWVWLLLYKKSHHFLRIYILLFGFFLYTQTRLIQSGELTTRQGVDFYLIEHLVLMVIGHEPWKQITFEWFIKFEVFLIFFSGLVFKYFSISHNKISEKIYAFVTLLIVSAFFQPTVDNIPASLAHHSLIHVIQTAWLKTGETKTVNTKQLFEFQKHNRKVEPIQSGKELNVVVIILESTGANMLDFYGSDDAQQGSTPFLSQFASRSLKFTDTQAIMTSTTKSLVSILCSREPYIGLSSFEATLGLPTSCLPERLAKLGYQTAFFQSAHGFYERRDLLSKHMGFQHFVALEHLPASDKAGKKSAGIFGMEDEVLLNENQRWLANIKSSQQPFIATYLTLAQHHPYFSYEKTRGFLKNDSKHYRDNFVLSLTYIDHYLAQLIEQYKKAGLYENTLFVVVGDHGEAFGLHHPQRFHNNSMYREGLWVPFFIVNQNLFPELIENHSISSLMDVAPTIENLLGLTPSQDYRGTVAHAKQEQRTIYSACWYPKRCLAATNQTYKYIYNFSDSAEELYLRSEDYWEQDNVANQHPELVEKFRNDVLSWYSNTQESYYLFYSSINSDFSDKPESYYQFPFDFMLKKLQFDI